VGTQFEITRLQPPRFASPNPNVLTVQVTVAQGQVLEAGSVLGRLGSGQVALSLAAAENGSEVPRFVLVDDVDATAGAVKTLAYSAGHFDRRFLKFGAGHTAANAYDALRAVGIHIGPAGIDLSVVN